MSDHDDLDGCDLSFDDPNTNTQDGEQVDALAMFADVWDDPDAVEERRRQLVEWDAATRGDG